MTHSHHILAARYALGIAGASEIEAAETLLDTDKDFAALVVKFQGDFDSLHDDIPPVAPPAGIWDRIEAAIDADEGKRQPRILSPQNIPWQEIAPSLEQKILFSDAQTGVRMILYRAGPGAVVTRHRNTLDEECLVLEGEIEIDGQPLKAGEIQIIPAGAMHGPISARNGAIIYIREGARL